MRKFLHIWGMLNICLALACSLFVEVFWGQVPCSLCLLQRASLIGLGIGLYLSLRYGLRLQYYAGCLLWSLFGMAVSLRQVAINVCKDPTSPPFFFLSYRMYTWAFIAFFISLLGISLLLLLPWNKEDTKSKSLATLAGSALAVLTVGCMISALLK